MFGLITGSGFYDIPELVDRRTESVDTPFGDGVEVTIGRWRDRDVCFLPRHGADHTIPPHAINYRANIAALATVGARSVLATAVSGGIRTDMTPGRFVLISDYLDFTTGRSTTFFDGSRRPVVSDPGAGGDATRGGTAEALSESPVRVVHTDMSEPYSPELRAVVRRAAEREGVPIIDGGVYCSTNGPRFETRAEIRMMRAAGGDLVGMTGYPEVALAVEAGLSYASIGVISNVAAGLGPDFGMEQDKLSVADIVDLMATATEPLYRLIGATVELGDTTAEGPVDGAGEEDR